MTTVKWKMTNGKLCYSSATVGTNRKAISVTPHQSGSLPVSLSSPGPLRSELYPLLGPNSRIERVLDFAHFGDQIRRLDKLRGSIPTCDDNV